MFRPIVTTFILLGLVALATYINWWPQILCRGVAPYGQHDYQCTYFVGR